jgi:predicted nucleic acid-binding protein
MTTAYFDSSALVKFVIREPESDALKIAVRKHRRRISSVIGCVEFDRALRRKLSGEDAARASLSISEKLDVIPVSASIAALAGSIEPPLRSLDAIHLATALRLHDQIDTVYCYDRRLAESMVKLGFSVEAPA